MQQQQTETVAAEVRRFIVDNFLFGQDDQGLGPDDSLLDRGVIDSTGVMELVLFLEQQFGVKVEDTELVPENLDSIERICAFIDRKLGA